MENTISISATKNDAVFSIINTEGLNESMTDFGAAMSAFTS